MAKAFSVLSWNIEHLKDRQPARISRVVDVLVKESPDVFAIYEVEGKDVYREFSERLPGYSFHITEGKQTQEILVGVKHKFTAFFSQRVEFKSGNSWLRPGAMLSIHLDGEDYTLMFLHLKSLTKPVGLGLRDDQLERLYKLKRKLDKAKGSPANFIALGDLNTMGMNYRGKKHDIPASSELEKMDKDMGVKSVSMKRLSKTYPHTWSNGSKSKYPPSDLDHVLAASHLDFKMWRGINTSHNSEVDVRGWSNQESALKKDRWIKEYSDHSYLYFELARA